MHQHRQCDAVRICFKGNFRVTADVKTAVDLIYKPQKSEFLRLAEKKGASILNGEAMLFYQAYYADCIYLGKSPNDAEAEKLYKEFLGGEV